MLSGEDVGHTRVSPRTTMRAPHFSDILVCGFGTSFGILIVWFPEMVKGHAVDDWLNRRVSNNWEDHCVILRALTDNLMIQSTVMLHHLQQTMEMETQLAFYKRELFVMDEEQSKGGMGCGKGKGKMPGKGRGKPS